MRNLYECYLRPSLATVCFLLSVVTVHSQVLNDGFIPPTVYRQAVTNVIKVTSGDYVYVSGQFDFHGDTPINTPLVKLRADGLLDTSFNPQWPGVEVESIPDIEVLTNNRVVYIATVPDGYPKVLVVLGPDGKHLKTITDSDYEAVEPDGSGGFYVGDSEGVIRYYNANLDLVRTVTHVNSTVTDIQWQNGQITVSGFFGMAWDAVEQQYYPRRALARFSTLGALDKSFNADAAMQGHIFVGGIVLQSDGKIVPVRKYTNIGVPNEHPGGMRLNADGSLDTSFKSPFPASVPFEDAFLSFGNLTVVGSNKILRLHHNGSVNNAFAQIPLTPTHTLIGGLADGSLVAANYQPATYGIAKFSSLGARVNDYYARLTRLGEIYSIDRKDNTIWIGGDFVRVGNHFTRNIARLNLDGTVLTKFRSSIVSPVRTVAALDNAKVLAQSGDRLHKFQHNGDVDPAFSFPYIPELKSVTKFVVQPDGKILVGGNLRLFRLNVNGSRDNSFDGDVGKDVINGRRMDFDLDRTSGKIFYTNWQYGGGIDKKELFRLNPDGSRDLSFNPPQFPSFEFYSEVVALDNQEVLLLKPAYMTSGQEYDIVKLNADGSLNEEFTNNLTDGYTWYYQYDNAARFGDRIIVYNVRHDPEELLKNYDAITIDGTPDPLFQIPATLKTFNAFYSDNDTELFVAGRISAGDREYQIVKVTYPATAASARVALEVENPLTFYPNPVAEKLNVNVNGSTIVKIMDATGYTMMTVPVDETLNTIDVQQLKPGRYIIEMETGGKTYREHLLKN